MNHNEEENDPELVMALNSGDHHAFEAIYRKYAADLYRYARRNIALKEDCEEIVQEVFESLWARHDTLRVVALRYYLLNSVRYKIIRYFQHSKVKQKYADHFRLFEAVYETSVKEEETGPFTIRERIEKSIALLPERCQTAMKLRLHENLSNGDIAKRMNITKKTVEMYMFKAFSHLRASYENIYKTN